MILQGASEILPKERKTAITVLGACSLFLIPVVVVLSVAIIVTEMVKI